MNDFLSAAELNELKLGGCGKDICISRHAIILSPQYVQIGSHSRVDAFCLITGNPKGVSIGTYAHLSAYVSILGADRTTIEDFCTLSVRCSLFTSNDDYLGSGLTNPTLPDEYRAVTSGPIHIKQHGILGCGSIVLPRVTIGRSAAVGALTLVNQDVDDFAIVAGTPMRRIGTRTADHVAKGEKFIQSLCCSGTSAHK
jgi:acetyltransferase-like isoleucine patch superfamily enzyme